MKRIIPLFFVLASLSSVSFGQVFKIELNQPDMLVVAAGNDTTLCLGHSITLGANPVVNGGTETFLYSWSPADGLDDPTSPNPVATPEESTNYTLTVVDANGCQATGSLIVNIDPCLGIENQDLLNEIVIYPNPSTGNINLSGLPSNTGELKVSMINSVGVEVLFSMYESGTLSIDLDLESLDLPRGVYFIRILVQNEVLIRKIQLI